MRTLTLVEMVQPCSACLITGQLARSICERIVREHNGVVFEHVRLDHPSKVRGVPGLEVEAFPALLLDNEQITAGSVPDRRAIERLLCDGI